MTSTNVSIQSKRQEKSTSSSATKTDNEKTKVLQLHEVNVTEYLLQLDIELSEKLSFFATKDSSSWRYLLVLLEISGHGVPWIAAAVLGVLITRGTSQQFACNMLLGLLLDLIVVGTFKVVFRRKRPIYNEKDMFATVSVDQYSFPSGHSTRAAMVAGSIGTYVTNQTNMVLVFLWAVCGASSRVLLGRHHIFDVIFGVVIGLAQFGVIMVVWLPEQLCHSIKQSLYSLVTNLNHNSLEAS